MLSTRRIVLAVAAATFVVLARPTLAAADCSVQERIDLGKQGYSKDEVDNLCSKSSGRHRHSSDDEDTDTEEDVAPRRHRSSPRKSDWPDDPSDGGGRMQAPPPAIATMCVTAMGACGMMQAIPVGSVCHCGNMYGSMPGIAR